MNSCLRNDSGGSWHAISLSIQTHGKHFQDSSELYKVRGCLCLPSLLDKVFFRSLLRMSIQAVYHTSYRIPEDLLGEDMEKNWKPRSPINTESSWESRLLSWEGTPSPAWWFKILLLHPFVLLEANSCWLKKPKYSLRGNAVKAEEGRLWDTVMEIIT